MSRTLLPQAGQPKSKTKIFVNDNFALTTTTLLTELLSQAPSIVCRTEVSLVLHPQDHKCISSLQKWNKMVPPPVDPILKK